MKVKDKFSKMVTCPRCGLKTFEGVETCPDCGLVFSRLEIATNKDAKRKILRGDRDYIIKTNKLPSDVSFIKLLLLCIFLGPLGVHNFYTGRYLKGSFLALSFTGIFLLVVFNAPLINIDGGNLVGALSTICGLILLMWPWDLFMIVLKKYKVPVAIDLQSESKEEVVQEQADEKTNSDNDFLNNQNDKINACVNENVNNVCANKTNNEINEHTNEKSEEIK